MGITTLCGALYGPAFSDSQKGFGADRNLTAQKRCWCVVLDAIDLPLAALGASRPPPLIHP